MYANVLKFHILIPHEKIGDPYFFLIPVFSYYAPNFEEVGGAYCFWDVCACVRVCVRPCVRPLHFLVHSITSEPCMLGF